MNEQPVDRWQDLLIGAIALVAVFLLLFALVPVMAAEPSTSGTIRESVVVVVP